ncbi:MAG: signal peptidase II, partial [Clostridia bacterium]|nr:signal peptidase II [Clostridia bacterium]
VAGRKNRLETVSISLILGGGIGNMIDRIFRGYVVDFLDFCAFPKIWNYVFNVADACVCVGVALLVLALILGEVRNAKEKKKGLSDGEKTPEEETHDPE